MQSEIVCERTAQSCSGLPMATELVSDYNIHKGLINTSVPLGDPVFP